MAHWSPATRIAFRFCFLYFAAYCLTNQILGGLLPLPNLEIPDPATLPPLRQIIFWTASHIFHAHLPLIYEGSGSGDKTFDWVLSFCLLIFAALITALWSILDRRRENYTTLAKWSFLLLRFAFSGQMIGYGMAKAVPLQMPFPFLTRLLEPFGDFSPMGVLWASVGASTPYEIFTGCAELLGGILLIVPRTALLGALLCLTDATFIFMLNMTYDVPVKLFSFHLILMAMLLLAPDLHRLSDFFFRNRPVAPSTQPAVFASPRYNKIALVAQIIFGLSLLANGAYGSWTSWHTYGGAREKSPLYGIWNIEDFSIDGQLRLPLLNDYDRFRRAIFDFPNTTAFQRMDNSFAHFNTVINSKDKTLALTKPTSKTWKANFTFDRPSPDILILDGKMDNHPTHLKMRLFDRNKFLLVNRGFHWIQEYPFNR